VLPVFTVRLTLLCCLILLFGSHSYYATPSAFLTTPLPYRDPYARFPIAFPLHTVPVTRDWDLFDTFQHFMVASDLRHQIPAEDIRGVPSLWLILSPGPSSKEGKPLSINSFFNVLAFNLLIPHIVLSFLSFFLFIHPFGVVTLLTLKKRPIKENLVF
jgi:hypothetical protein